MHFSLPAIVRIRKEEEEDEAPEAAEGVRNRAWVRGFSLQGIPLARKPFPVLDGALRRERPFPEERLLIQCEAMGINYYKYFSFV